MIKASNINASNDYSHLYKDVSRCSELSIICDPSLHFALYGRRQGRDTLAKINSSIQRIFILAPSFMKQCGIGEYARYLKNEIERTGRSVTIVFNSIELFEFDEKELANSLILVNHGPGLFDGLNEKLSQGESTASMIHNLYKMMVIYKAYPLILLHSLVNDDHEIIGPRQQLILDSDIPKIVFIRSASENFFLPWLELGVSPVDGSAYNNSICSSNKIDRETRKEKIGFFGFFQYGGKDFDSLFHLISRLDAHLVGSVATANKGELSRFENKLNELNSTHDLGSGWVSDSELLTRLSEADYFYLPQNDYDYWNNSATARFVTNLERPLFLPPHQPFLDMEEGAIFAQLIDLPRIVAKYRTHHMYETAVNRVKAFREKSTLAQTIRNLFNNINQRITSVSTELLEDVNSLSYEKYYYLDPSQKKRFKDCLKPCIKGALSPSDEIFTSTFKLPQRVQKWKRHYEFTDLISPSGITSINEIYRAFTKADASLSSLLRLCVTLNNESSSDDLLTVIKESFEECSYAENGTIRAFDDIILLHNGNPLGELDFLGAKESIQKYLLLKDKFYSSISSGLEALPSRPNKLHNLSLIVGLPARCIATKLPGDCLNAIDFSCIDLQKSYVARLSWFLNQASRKGMALESMFVFDFPILEDVDPHCYTYYSEEFAVHDEELFVLLNATRKILKRDPSSFELIMHVRLLRDRGIRQLLMHLLEISPFPIKIINLHDAVALDQIRENFVKFIRQYRDPLFGSISMRNKYEVSRRNAYRLKLKIDHEMAGLQSEFKDNLIIYSWIYSKLSKLRFASSHFLASAEDSRNTPSAARTLSGLPLELLIGKRPIPLALRPNERLDLTTRLGKAVSDASVGIGYVSKRGAWILRGTASLTIKVDKSSIIDDSEKLNVLRLRVAFSRMLTELREALLNICIVQPSFDYYETYRMPANDSCAFSEFHASQLVSIDKQTDVIELRMPAIDYKREFLLMISTSPAPQERKAYLGSAMSQSLRLRSLTFNPQKEIPRDRKIELFLNG